MSRPPRGTESPIRTLVAVGDRSPIGRAVLEHALERFDVRAVVFPTNEVSRRFYGELPPRWRTIAGRLTAPLRGVDHRFPGDRLGRRLNWEDICSGWEPDEFDLFLSGGFPAIFPDSVLSVGRRRINVHTSLLPQLKGRHPHYWAVAWGLEQSGLTAHEMTKDVDQGAIVGQIVVPIPHGTDYDTHYADLRMAVPGLLDQVAHWLNSGERVTPVDVEPSWSPGDGP